MARMERIARLREHLWREGLDAFVLFSAEEANRPSVQYLSGFTGSFAILLITAAERFLITDNRYFLRAGEESDFTLVKMADRDPWPHLEAVLRDAGVRRLLFEADRLTVDLYLRLGRLSLDLAGSEGLLRRLRAVKDDEELVCLRRAAEIASDAFDEFYPGIRAGMTEAQLAAALVHAMRRRGAEQPVRGRFVVASGVRGASPHGVFTDKVVEDGDFITFDFGAVYQGYVSDITRTVGVGRVASELVKVYEAVLEAERRTLAAVAAGISGAALDAVARDYLTAHGYGPYFTHGVGHGIGLELHELPLVNRRNADPLPAGAVITVEPGVYLPGLGGVRIEDDVVVREGGGEILTSAHKGLVIL